MKTATVDIEAYLHFPYLTETELYESQLPQIARKSPVREATGFDWGHSKKLYKQTSLEPTSFGSIWIPEFFLLHKPLPWVSQGVAHLRFRRACEHIL